MDKKQENIISLQKEIGNNISKMKALKLCYGDDNGMISDPDKAKEFVNLVYENRRLYDVLNNLKKM